MEEIMEKYKIKENNLVTYNDSGDILWTGKPHGYNVKKIISNPKENICLALFNNNDLYKYRNRAFFIIPKSFKNIARVNTKGKIIWKTDLPKTTIFFIDFYVNLQWASEIDYHSLEPYQKDYPFAVGITASGYLIVIDPNSGKHINQFLLK